MTTAGGELRVTPPESMGPNPDTWTGTVNGSASVGYIEAGIQYIDEGADPGWAEAWFGVVFDVGPN
jgi:hypothetical protein